MNVDDLKKFDRKYSTEDIVIKEYEQLSLLLLSMIKDEKNKEKMERHII